MVKSRYNLAKTQYRENEKIRPVSRSFSTLTLKIKVLPLKLLVGSLHDEPRKPNVSTIIFR